MSYSRRREYGKFVTTVQTKEKKVVLSHDQKLIRVHSNFKINLTHHRRKSDSDNTRRHYHLFFAFSRSPLGAGGKYRRLR